MGRTGEPNQGCGDADVFPTALSRLTIARFKPVQSMKTAHPKKHSQANPSKAHSTPSWTKNMSASGKGHRRHPTGGIAGKSKATLMRGGVPHL
jgi:hypothetical protein